MDNQQGNEGAYLLRFDMVIEVTSPEPINYEEKVRKLNRGLRLSGDFITHTCSHHNLSVTHIETLKQRIGVKIEV